jgi:PAS domain-containing protein
MGSQPAATPDFKRIFEAAPGCYLLLKPNPPVFTIIGVTDAYARATNTVRENIIGRGLFEVFPDNPDDKNATGEKNLTASLMRVLEHKKIDFMKIQKYDIKEDPTTSQKFEIRYWSPDNSPVLDENGEVVCIIHHVTDVTGREKLIHMFGDTSTNAEGESGDLSQTERLSRIMIDREVRMSELKKEIAEFKASQAR